ncbi:histidine phosphatase family protein [Marinifilum fragile]|uniref:histidine phosphatase family protein n=1 Tax=Marinifilum fragile TaxID=570161 RepID=UPI0006D149BC|nr:histidine phosphatase family protein [Marinifilum fragile]
MNLHDRGLKKFAPIKYLLLIICGFVMQSCVTQNRYMQPVNTYDAFTCVNEVDAIEQLELQKQGKRKLQIYLIRHAKPNLKKKLFYSAEEAQQYVYDYNSVPIVPFDPEMVKVNLNPNHFIYCSNLPRSQETALAIFGKDYPVVSDSIFREYEIKVVKASSIIKLPLPIWQFFSRGSWLLGFNHKGIESRKETKQRVKYAVENLIKVAEKEETAVLVAHGMLNHGLENHLKKQGWQVIQKNGQANLGATILVKIVDLE